MMKKYQIIYADPPWSYNDKRNGNLGGCENHYETMNLEEIKKMNINEIADDNCILFLWVTFPLLKEGMEVIESWGFEYKTIGFSWIKLNKDNANTFFGIGYYTKSNCEVCLIGVKGKPKPINDKISSAIISKLREHSRKPDECRTKIVELMGDLPRIELFAREKFEGWDVYGDETPKDIQTILKGGENGNNLSSV